ncbi:MAG: hypothetical protein KC766_18720 [Myxococcales bacterium]|nr:hypothetical protein [Myxococcales bacterium]
MLRAVLAGGFGLLLAGAWAALMFPSMRGYGYAGYNGWQNHASFWYFGGTDTFHSTTVRGAGQRNSGRGGK